MDFFSKLLGQACFFNIFAKTQGEKTQGKFGLKTQRTVSIGSRSKILEKTQHIVVFIVKVSLASIS